VNSAFDFETFAERFLPGIAQGLKVVFEWTGSNHRYVRDRKGDFMAYKVLVTEKVDKACINALRTRGCEVTQRTDLTEEQLIECVNGFDAMVVRSHTPVTRAVIEAGRSIKVIGRAGVSIDNIDVAAATERGVIVCNAPTSNIVSAAEFAMSLILACARKLPQANASMHAGQWGTSFDGRELYEKTLAIVGLGRVGGLVAERASAFGMKIVGYDPYCNADRANALGVTLYDDIEALLPIADVITVHVPRTSETRGMFGPNEFAAMKDGVILVNIARGGIFDEKSLADFVAAGKIGAVGLDAFDEEPCTTSPLRDFDNVIITPHIGAATAEAQRRAGVQIAMYVTAGLAGSLVPTAVNMAPVPPEVLDAVGPYVPACQMLGSLLAQISPTIPKNLKLTASGNIAAADTTVLVASVLKGLLAYKNGITVTPVNAEQVAKRHGIEVTTASDSTALGYFSSVSIVADGIEASCTRTDPGRPARIISLFGYDMDIEPGDQSLIFEYGDGSGRIGVIGTILGAHDVNITTMKIGTREDSDRAVVYMNVEGDVTEAIMDELREGISDLKNLWYVKM
jgi:D-3-phosphoglycerate dehydrogenase / 2-oxoglutarate reductase